MRRATIRKIAQKTGKSRRFIRKAFARSREVGEEKTKLRNHDKYTIYGTGFQLKLLNGHSVHVHKKPLGFYTIRVTKALTIFMNLDKVFK